MQPWPRQSFRALPGGPSRRTTFGYRPTDAGEVQATSTTLRVPEVLREQADV